MSHTQQYVKSTTTTEMMLTFDLRKEPQFELKKSPLVPSTDFDLGI